MPSKSFFPASRRAHRATRGQRLALCLGTALCLGACATPPAPVTAPPPPAPTTTLEPPKPVPPPSLQPPPPTPPPSADRHSTPATEAAASASLSFVLGYADRLRGLSSNELVQELTLLGEPGAVPSLQLQTALVLMHLHQPAASARALGLLQRVMTHPAPESAALKPLARLLATGLADQRRLEDTVDRQAQQLRDHQRRLDVLSDRLDAMRDIERSLTPRGPGRAPAP
ncbi:MAG: hypothetical protein IV088_06720 [Hydrogenophaga sp.]|uniref:hypothetical protein n=1 Tax=Hydrogenophaga sp. TaxID=1904254 RepID=UPI0025B93BB1|nr:hypothetical protein [Hydrogenophaga sp.]MBT9550522.1 hypothetical protein [Hydrogenophaga sp.]